MRHTNLVAFASCTFLNSNLFYYLCLVRPGTFSVSVYQYRLVCPPYFCHVVTCSIQVTLILINQRGTWRLISFSEDFLLLVKAFFLFRGWSGSEEYTSSRTHWSYLIKGLVYVGIYILTDTSNFCSSGK
jgi:hypothetical protein